MNHIDHFEPYEKKHQCLRCKYCGSFTHIPNEHECIEMVKAERDELRAEVERLKADNASLLKQADALHEEHHASYMIGHADAMAKCRNEMRQLRNDNAELEKLCGMQRGREGVKALQAAYVAVHPSSNGLQYLPDLGGMCQWAVEEIERLRTALEMLRDKYFDDSSSTIGEIILQALASAGEGGEKA